MLNFQRKFKIFKQCDIFGYPIAFTMNNKNSFKTIFGGLLTSILIFFFFGVIFYSFFKLFTNQNLETLKYESNLGNSYGFLQLSDQNFMIAIRFDQSILNNWTKPYMDLKVIHVIQYRNSTTPAWRNKTNIVLKACQYSDFVGLEKEFDELELYNALCFERGSNLSLEGNYQENIFSYFQISLTSCLDSSVCQDNETIYSEISKFEKIRINFFTTNNVVDETNYLHPISRHIISDMHFLVDPIKSVYRTADIFLNEVEITTDEGFIPTLFSSITPNKSFTYNQEFREQTIFTTLDAQQKNNIGDFYFRKSQKKFRYERSLGNLLTILSYLGGIWSTCYITFRFIVNAYSRYFFITSLSNKLYNYPSQMKKKNANKQNAKFKEENIEKKLNDGKNANNSQIKISPNISPNNSPFSRNIYQKIIEKIETYLSYDRKLKFSFGQMWQFMFKKLVCFLKNNSEKAVLMNKSEENLMKDLDITNVLRKLHEVDKIKSLLFSDEQQIILGFSPKPEIISCKVDPNVSEIASNGMKLLSKLSKVRKNKKTRLLQDELNFDEIRPFKQLIFAWKTLKNSGMEKISINENLEKMFGEEFSKIVDLNEEEMLLFCDQQKLNVNKFANLMRNLKKSEENKGSFEVKTLIGEKCFSLHSENFVDCFENKSSFVINMKNNTKRRSKLKNGKEKLGRNFWKKKETTEENFSEKTEKNVDNLSRREFIITENSERDKEEGEGALMRKKRNIYKSNKY